MNMDFEYSRIGLASFVTTFVLQGYFLPALFESTCAPYRKLNDVKKHAWVKRFNSIIYSIPLGLGALYVYCWQSDLNHDKIWGSSHLVRMLTSVIVGLLCHELMVKAINPLDTSITGRSMIVHHLAIIPGAVTCIVYGSYLWFVNFRLLAELSTPFLNMGWILLHSGYSTKSRAYATVALTFVVMFTLTRILGIAPVWINFFLLMYTEASYQTGYTWYVMVFTVVTLDVLNVYWFAGIISKIRESTTARPSTKVQATNNNNPDKTTAPSKVQATNDNNTNKHD